MVGRRTGWYPGWVLTQCGCAFTNLSATRHASLPSCALAARLPSAVRKVEQGIELEFNGDTPLACRAEDPKRWSAFDGAERQTVNNRNAIDRRENEHRSRFGVISQDKVEIPPT